MSDKPWLKANCILKISTDKKQCDGCYDRHRICPKCCGPVFRIGMQGDGMECHHCGAHYEDYNDK